MRFVPAASLALAVLVAGAVQASPTLRIEARIDEGEWLASSAVVPLKGEVVTLRVAPVEGADGVRWYRIVPDLSRTYKNANHPWEADPYQWVGFDEIGYERVELPSLRGLWTVAPLDVVAQDSSTSARQHVDVGSFWFQVEVEKAGKVVARSAGLADNDHRGLSPEIFRVSVRGEEGYVGWLTSYFNVPGLFGSVIHQSEHYIGVDCADVLVAAQHHWKGRTLRRDYNVAMLVTSWPRVLEVVLGEGVPAREVRWTDHVLPGDAIAVRYRGARSFGHIGVLYRDRGRQGVLDGPDEVLHAGPDALHVSTLAEGAFDGEVVILRPE